MEHKTSLTLNTTFEKGSSKMRFKLFFKYNFKQLKEIIVDNDFDSYSVKLFLKVDIIYKCLV